SSSGSFGLMTSWPWSFRKVGLTPPGTDCQPCRKRTFMRLSVVLLCPVDPLFKPPWRQAVASPPVVEPGLLVASQPAVHRAAAVLGLVAAQGSAQDPREQPPHLPHCQRRRPYFFPAWLPASGTRSRPA